MASNKPPQHRITGIRGSIPQGYILGRVSAGYGDVELISMGKAQSVGLVPSSLPPSGAAGGDLSGTYPAPTVAKLQGIPVTAGTPSNLAVLLYHTAGATWLPIVLATVAYSGAYSDLSGLPAIHNIPAAGTTGQVLTKNSNTDYDVSWATPSGGGGGAGASSFWLDGTDGYVGIVDSNGVLVTDSHGYGVYSKDPVLPAAIIPDLSATYALASLRASSSVFGLAKVDNTSITAALGVVSAKVATGAFSASLSATVTGLTANSYDPLIYDTVQFDSKSWYDHLTGKYTPQVAGYYLFFSQATVSIADGDTALSFMQKNGATVFPGTAIPTGATTAIASGAVAVIHLNGTTDYVRGGVYPGNATSCIGGGLNSYFQGFLLQPD